jgi:hypothetical protein
MFRHIRICLGIVPSKMFFYVVGLMTGKVANALLETNRGSQTFGVY